MTSIGTGMLEVCELKESIRGVSREINRRTWRISELVERYKGSEKRLIKPVRNKKVVVEQALALHREVKKLYVIKADLLKIEKEL